MRAAAFLFLWKNYEISLFEDDLDPSMTTKSETFWHLNRFFFFRREFRVQCSFTLSLRGGRQQRCNASVDWAQLSSPVWWESNLRSIATPTNLVEIWHFFGFRERGERRQFFWWFIMSVCSKNVIFSPRNRKQLTRHACDFPQHQDRWEWRSNMKCIMLAISIRRTSGITLRWHFNDHRWIFGALLSDTTEHIYDFGLTRIQPNTIAVVNSAKSTIQMKRKAEKTSSRRSIDTSQGVHWIFIFIITLTKTQHELLSRPHTAEWVSRLNRKILSQLSLMSWRKKIHFVFLFVFFCLSCRLNVLNCDWVRAK